MDFSGQDLQGVPRWSRAHGAEFNTSLGFVSAQSKPITPLQSPSPPAPHPSVESGILRGPGRAVLGRGLAPLLPAGPRHPPGWRSFRVVRAPGHSTFSPLESLFG